MLRLRLCLLAVVVLLVSTHLTHADDSDESTGSPESSESEESTGSPESSESEDTTGSPESSDTTGSPSNGKGKGKGKGRNRRDIEDGSVHSRIRRWGSRSHKKYCFPGCSLVNVTSGEEQETRTCPSWSTCERGPYDMTIDGYEMQVFYCQSDWFGSILDQVETYIDIHFIKLAKTACSATNGTLSWDRDCCDDQTCDSDTYQYDYQGSTFDFTFCEDSEEDTTLLETMACKQYCRSSWWGRRK